MCNEYLVIIIGNFLVVFVGVGKWNMIDFVDY